MADQETLRHVFSRLDTDSDEFITTRDLNRILKQLGSSLDQAYIEEMIW